MLGLLPLLLAAQGAATAIAAPPAKPVGCLAAEPQRAVLRDGDAKPHILRDGAPATLQRAVLYTEDGCTKPVVVRYNVGKGAR
jgi:hypothetical protein